MDTSLWLDLMRPVFVYGTLRPECGNSDLWRKLGGTARYDGEVRAHGWAMMSRGIPFAVRIDSINSAPYIVGCLIHPPQNSDAALAMRESLDRLEGHPHWYERIVIKVRTPNGDVPAWIYDGSKVAHGELVPNGDYYSTRAVVR